MITLCLTEYYGAEIIERDEDGRLVKGVFIPMDFNNFYQLRDTNAVWCKIIAKPYNYSNTDRTHYLVPMWSKEHWNKMLKLGYTKNFLGNIFTYDSKINK